MMNPEVAGEQLQKMIGAAQRRLAWSDRIVMPMQEHLWVVEKHGQLIVKCDCGHEFGDYHRNWKLGALIYDRNPKEIYPGVTGPDPEWCLFREFYCPGCLTQLEVEAVPHGIPLIFSFEPAE